MSPDTAGNPDRRAQILAAATRVFARQGFEATSMNEIIAEAGISKGGVYWYFKSKDEIIGTIVRDFFPRDLDNALPWTNTWQNTTASSSRNTAKRQRNSSPSSIKPLKRR